MDIIAMLSAGFTAFNKLADAATLIATELKRANDNAWFQEKSSTFKPLESAGPTTGAQDDQAAQNIGDLIHKL